MAPPAASFAPVRSVNRAAGQTMALDDGEDMLVDEKHTPPSSSAGLRLPTTGFHAVAGSTFVADITNPP